MNRAQPLLETKGKGPCRWVPQSIWIGAAVLTFLTASLIAPVRASAQEVDVLATLTNQPPLIGAPPVPLIPHGQQTLYLWAYGGDSASASGTTCSSAATGDEICGIRLHVETSTRVQLTDFSGNAAFDSAANPLPFVTTLAPNGRSLRMNAFDLGTPSPGFRFIGSLSVQTTNADANDSISVSGEAVGTNLETRPIPLHPISVPEPSLGPALFAGGIGLAAFSGRRARRNVSLR